ncbi:MAG: hypothetical protein OXU20_13955 [Myxococcales bacterium]|nr:hypothetical protein [Myxococcales bacterium]
MGLFLYIALAFQAWMLADALRRRAGIGWYLLILVPLGALVYFFTVKSRDLDIRPAQSAPEVPTIDVEALRLRAEESPSFHNRAALGWALLETEAHEQALSQFDLALSTHPTDKEGLLGRGMALLALGDAEAAIDPLSEVVDRNFAFRDYRAARQLVRALYESGQIEAALEMAQTIARKSERYEHKLALAKLQRSAARECDAEATLLALIADFEAEPDYVRRRYGALVTEARRLLRSLHPEAQ